MKNVVLLIFLVSLLTTRLLGQYRIQSPEQLARFNSIPNESIYIHYNDQLLLTGEYLYYKFYCLNTFDRTPSEVSRIGYVELKGKNGETVFRHKVSLIEGLGQGDFFIPVAIETGHYKLIGYTQWMQNDGEKSFFRGDVVIVNPYSEIPKAVSEASEILLTHAKQESPADSLISEKRSAAFELIIPRKTFRKRKLVKFTIRDVMGMGESNISISVRKEDSVANPFQKIGPYQIEKISTSIYKPDMKINDSIVLPEMRGELISGRITSKDLNLPVANQDIGLSIAGTNGIAKISRTNDKGVFYFNLDANGRNNEIVLNVLSQNNDYEIILTPEKRLKTKSFEFNEISISHDLNSQFEQRSIYNQIENAFFEQKADSTIIMENTKPAHKVFQERYNLDNYTRFPTLKETIVEIIEGVLMNRKKGKYVIQVRGEDEFFIDSGDTPLLLVDNVLIQNTNALLDFDVKKIQNIGISRNEYYIGPKRYQGIFAIETRDGDYLTMTYSEKSYVEEIPGAIPIKSYFEPDYSKEQSNKTMRIVDFRRQLLWLPNVKMNKKRTFEFYTSDNTGTYEISLEGFTENGEPISLLEKIYVE